MHLGQRFWFLDEQLLEARRVYAEQPRQADAVLWHLLWTLVEETNHQKMQSDSNGFTALTLQRALQIIEMDLDRPLPIAELAAEVNISYSSLNRLFHQQFGLSANAYLRTRRVERARYLLQNTALQIKAIAGQVGFGDLQFFDKTMRRAIGVSPRKLRDESQWRNEQPQAEETEATGSSAVRASDSRN